MYPLLAIGDKRPIINDTDGFYRESKRHCTQPSGYNHEYGSATESSYVLSSGGAQNGDFNGSGNILYQPNLDTELPEHFEPQYSPGLPLLSGLPEFGPGYPTRDTLNGVIPVQSGEIETYATESGNSIESFTDDSPFNIVTQTDSKLNIGYLLNGISKEEVSVIEEPNTTAIRTKHVPEASKPPSLWDDYACIPLQFASDYSPNSEGGDKMSQDIGGSMSQSSGIVTSGTMGKLVRNEKTYLSQPTNLH